MANRNTQSLENIFKSDGNSSVSLQGSTSASNVQQTGGGGGLVISNARPTKDPSYAAIGNSLAYAAGIEDSLDKKEQKKAINQAQADAVSDKDWKEMRNRKGKELVEQDYFPINVEGEIYNDMVEKAGWEWFNSLGDHQKRAYDEQIAINHGTKTTQLLQERLAEKDTDDMTPDEYADFTNGLITEYQASIKNQTDSFRATSSKYVEHFLKKHADIKYAKDLQDTKEQRLGEAKDAIIGNLILSSENTTDFAGNEVPASLNKDTAGMHINNIRFKIKADFPSLSNKEVDEMAKEAVVTAIATGKIDDEVGTQMLASERDDLAKSSSKKDSEGTVSFERDPKAKKLPSWIEADPDTVNAIIRAKESYTKLSDYAYLREETMKARQFTVLDSQFNEAVYSDNTKTATEILKKALALKVTDESSRAGIRRMISTLKKDENGLTKKQKNARNSNTLGDALKIAMVKTDANIAFDSKGAMDFDKVDQKKKAKLKVLYTVLQSKVDKWLVDNDGVNPEKADEFAKVITRSVVTNADYYNEEGELGLRMDVPVGGSTRSILVNHGLSDLIFSEEFSKLPKKTQDYLHEFVNANSKAIETIENTYTKERGMLFTDKKIPQDLMVELMSRASKITSLEETQKLSTYKTKEAQSIVAKQKEREQDRERQIKIAEDRYGGAFTGKKTTPTGFASYTPPYRPPSRPLKDTFIALIESLAGSDTAQEEALPTTQE